MHIPDFLGKTIVDAEKELKSENNQLNYDIVVLNSMRRNNDSIETEHRVIRQKYCSQENRLYLLADGFMLINK